MSGLEAAVTVASPGACPIAAASEATPTPIDAITRSTVTVEDRIVEEFEADSAIDREGTTEVFDGEDRSVYRFERDADAGCVCDCVETHGCPVVDVSARDGRLRVVFRPEDLEALREIVSSLRERFDGVRLQHLIESRAETGRDTVVVDRGRLTDRQREVLRTAYELGYFEHPKGANAQEVATVLEISSATFRGHLAAAQSKLFDAIVDG